jgi:hypothetical protein
LGFAHPDDADRFVDVGPHYLPTSTATGLRDVLPIVNAVAAGSSGQPSVLIASELTPGILKSANIVHVGFLSGLGVVRDPLFESSGFAIGASYDELIDRASNIRYMSDWGEVTENRTPHRDYGYLASFPGAAGTRIVIVAGTRDAAVMQAAEVASDKAQLDQLAGKANCQGAFEGLHEVRTLGNLNLGAVSCSHARCGWAACGDLIGPIKVSRPASGERSPRGRSKSRTVNRLHERRRGEIPIRSTPRMGDDTHREEHRIECDMIGQKKGSILSWPLPRRRRQAYPAWSSVSKAGAGYTTFSAASTAPVDTTTERLSAGS